MKLMFSRPSPSQKLRSLAHVSENNNTLISVGRLLGTATDPQTVIRAVLKIRIHDCKQH